VLDLSIGGSSYSRLDVSFSRLGRVEISEILCFPCNCGSAVELENDESGRARLDVALL